MDLQSAVMIGKGMAQLCQVEKRKGMAMNCNAMATLGEAMLRHGTEMRNMVSPW